MGGMIVQAAAIEHPARVRSLTSIMSTTGDRRVGVATREALGALLQPPARTREEAIERAVAAYRVIGSPGFARTSRRCATAPAARSTAAHDPKGVARQLVAVLASRDRTPGLRGLRMPTLVVHGREDPLVGAVRRRGDRGRDPGAELLVFDGMGHDLPRALWGEITGRIAALVERAEREA